MNEYKLAWNVRYRILSSNRPRAVGLRFGMNPPLGG